MWKRIQQSVRFVSAIGTMADWAWRVFLWVFGLTAAGVIAWLLTTWSWYWSTFGWAGAAIAFLAAYLSLGAGTLLFAVATSYLQRGTASAPSDDGPLVWYTNLTLEGGMHGPIHSLRFRGTNISQREVELVTADITSAVNGARIVLEVVAVSGSGINEIVPVDRIQLIPPGAPIELVAKFNPPSGLERQVFLDTWRQFFLTPAMTPAAIAIPSTKGALWPSSLVT